MPSILFRNVSKTYSAVSSFFGKAKQFSALENLSFSAGKSGIIGVAGKNGSGKTTLLKLIAGLLLPDKGEIRIFGSHPFSETAKKTVGYMGESDGFHQRLTPEENILFFSSLYGIRIGEKASFLSRMFDILNINPATYIKRTDGLSSGERKKFAVIKTFIHSPPLILLDEPDKSMDEETLLNFNDFIKKEREKGRLFFYVSHNYSLLKKISDEIMLLDSGSIKAHFKNKREFPFLEAGE